jgi:PEP-CTERM motif
MKFPILLCCGVALACIPVRAGSFSSSASVVSSTGCGNASQTGTTSAGVFVGATPGPGPLICPDGNGIFSGADVSSLGTLSALAETTAQGGPSRILAPFSVTSTATLIDTLTFSCTPSCPPGTLTGSLVATMTGAVFSQIDPNGFEYASFTTTITDLTTTIVNTATGELCPNLAQSVNCTVAETNPSSGYSVTDSFTIVPGDQYTFDLVMTSYASVLAGDNSEVQVLATQKDPLNLNLPTNVNFTSASGQFLAPEPSSWMLVAAGLAFGVFVLRRRHAVKF